MPYEKGNHINSQVEDYQTYSEGLERLVHPPYSEGLAIILLEIKVGRCKI